MRKAVILFTHRLTITSGTLVHECLHRTLRSCFMFQCNLYVHRKIAHHPHYYVLCVCEREPPLPNCHIIRMHVCLTTNVFSLARRANCKSQNDVSKWFDNIRSHTHTLYQFKCVEFEKGICVVVTLRFLREYFV